MPAAHLLRLQHQLCHGHVADERGDVERVGAGRAADGAVLHARRRDDHLKGGPVPQQGFHCKGRAGRGVCGKGLGGLCQHTHGLHMFERWVEAVGNGGKSPQCSRMILPQQPQGQARFHTTQWPCTCRHTRVHTHTHTRTHPWSQTPGTRQCAAP